MCRHNMLVNGVCTGCGATVNPGTREVRGWTHPLPNPNLQPAKGSSKMPPEPQATAEEYLKLKREESRVVKSQAEASGRKKQILEQLKRDTGCSSFEEASNKSQELVNEWVELGSRLRELWRAYREVDHAEDLHQGVGEEEVQPDVEVTVRHPRRPVD